MDGFNLSKITKRYIIISISVVLFAIIVLFIINNSLYIISGNKSFTVKIISADGDKNVSKILSLYLIPRDATSLRLESSNGTNIPGDEIIKPLTPSDTTIGIHKLDLKFTPQYDILTNSRESEGCVYGEYPKIVNYRCADPSQVIVYDSTNPLDNGKRVQIPPTPITALINNIVRENNRTLNAEPYKDGLLLLNAQQISMHELPLGELSLKFVDTDGDIKDVPLKGDFKAFQNGRYALLADSNGTDGFAILDNEEFKIYIYSSPDDAPEIISIDKKPDVGLSNICDLSNNKLVCYTGIATAHTHSDEDQEHIDSLDEGILTVYSIGDAEEEKSVSVPKEDLLDNLCVDKFGQIHTLADESIDIISVEGEKISYSPIAHKASSISCGSKTHITLDNKIYAIQEDGSAHLIYASELLPMVSAVSQGDKVHMIGHYEFAPQGRFSFSATEPSKPHDKPRVSDVVASIVDKHKETVNFEARFTPDSIDYIVPKHFAPEGAVVDESSVKKLQESTDKFNLGFKPKFHNVPNY